MVGDLISCRDKTTEQIVLSKILSVGRVPPDLLPDYFQGEERFLYLDIEKQWNKWGKLDAQILKKNHTSCFKNCLTLSGSYTEVTLEILHDNWMKRQIGKMIGSIDLGKNPKITIEELQTHIADISFKKRTEEYNQELDVQKIMTLSERGMTNNLSVIGYTTGITELDELTNGVELSKMYALGALKKTGKSRFMVYMALKFLEQNAGVMINTLEMTSVQLNILALAYYSTINSKLIGRKMEWSDYKLLVTNLGRLSDLKWRIYREQTVPRLKARIMFERRNRPINVCFVDYIQRMRSAEKHKNRTHEVEDISNSLANLSREIDCAIIPLSQLSGEAERLENVMPNMKHFKESQTIAEASDVILTLHNFNRSKDPFHEDGSYKLQDMHCRIEQRYDVSGPVVKFLGDLRTCRFQNDVT